MIRSPHIVIDIEANGPIVATHSMVNFGAVIVEKDLKRSFYGELKPISDLYVPEALAVSGFTHEQTLLFPNPKETMEAFALWIKENVDGKPIFISDNPAFDFAWINWYFLTFTGSNPFGHSARRIGDIYCGMKMNMRLNNEWKRLYRKTKHTHNPLDDAKGNAEALLAFVELGLRL